MVSKTIELVRVPGVRIPPAPESQRAHRVKFLEYKVVTGGFETEYDCNNTKA